MSLLTGAPPYGLPGTRIDRVKFQRGAEGHPLDDIVVHALDGDGSPAVLEIQAERSLRFTSSDKQFRSVVGQVTQASKQSNVFETRRELAVAVGRAPFAVQGPYQEVLSAARQLGSAGSFMARVERPHTANSSMRNFVKAFKTHLQHADAPNDDETVWRLLSRLQILHFDFTAQMSKDEAWQTDRAGQALHPEDAGRATALWRCLVELAIEAAAAGGGRSCERLLQDVQALGFRLAGDLRYAPARGALAEDAHHALQDIADRVGNIELTRGQLRVPQRCLSDRYDRHRGTGRSRSNA